MKAALEEDAEAILKLMASNPQKTVFMLLNQKKFGVEEQESIKVGEAQISLSHSTKLLGMIVEDTLSWNKHFTELIGPLNRRLYTIRRIAYQIPSGLV